SRLEPFSFKNNHLILKAEHSFYKDSINARYLSILEKSVSQIYQSPVTVEIYDDTDIENFSENKNHFSEEIIETPISIFSEYSFDNFIPGNDSKFAYSAAMAVAEDPGGTYNPLFIAGDVGLGKTHLMYAILNYIKRHYPEKKVLYCTCEEFTNEFTLSIRERKNDTFQNKYRKIDVLLIDDIQFLIGKTSTQEEFFHTFNALRTANKQIIISSDQLPEKLNQLEKRLVSRFSQGLTVDIYPPDFETRCAILDKKAVKKGITITKDVTYFIAQNIDSNIRELEGAINKVTSYSQLTKNPITMELTKIALDETLKNRGNKQLQHL
ncbi:MAG: chromosomal replication initiator protein DnaA, partial [Lachnospirales bacterium]